MKIARVILAALLAAACGAALGAPVRLRVRVGAATDSTVVVSASWLAPGVGTPPFTYSWSVAPLGGVTFDGATTDSTGATVAVPRADTAARWTFRISASNAVGTGPALADTFPVPARLTAPGPVDSLTVKIDSIVALDMLLHRREVAGLDGVQAGPRIYCRAVGGHDASRGACTAVERLLGWPDSAWQHDMRVAGFDVPGVLCIEGGFAPCRSGGPDSSWQDRWGTAPAALVNDLSALLCGAPDGNPHPCVGGGRGA